MADASLRNTKAIHARITKIRKELISRFEDIVAATVTSVSDDSSSDNTDRASTAIAQHQLQVSTAGLIKAAEALQTLIRELQEIWLFGQLNTLGNSELQQSSDETAIAVAQMIEQLLKNQSDGLAVTT